MFTAAGGTEVIWLFC